MLPFILVIVRFLLRLRYKIQVKGLDTLEQHRFDPSQGILFLPNHPAEIDPVIIEALLFKRFKIRPLVVEHFYHLKGWRFFMDLVGALPLPTMAEKANKWRAKRVDQQFDRMVSCLVSGENLLIYPSGSLKSTGSELLGGASLTHNLLHACPNARVVLIRTTGLWGSQFSRALTGNSPHFGKVIWSCTKILLKNGIFFTPKREVLIELEIEPHDFLSQGSRLEMNQYLQKWYNKQGPEPLKLVPYFFWKKELPVVSTPESAIPSVQHREISAVILQEVTAFLSTLSKKPLEQIDRKAHLSYDLGLDSLDLVQVYVFLDEKYGVGNLASGSLMTVEDVLQSAAGNGKGEAPQKEVGLAPFVWPQEKRADAFLPEGSTLQEVFLRSVKIRGSTIACVDALTGAMTYKQLKMRALILAEKIHALPGSHVGIMLPSSVVAYLVILATLLAGKIPVMLNWTVGVKALDHAADLTGFQKVITSMKFLDKLENEELGKVEELFCFLEEIRETISLKDKLRASLLQLKRVKGLLKTLHLDSISSSDPAVILFTSGTEALPKGVPLSHSNLLSNQRAGLAASSLSAEDILYGVLPPFHSFGFSITGLFPLLAGLRICYAPDPTNSHGLVRDIERYKPTLFFCAPSFIKALFRLATPAQLASLRLIVSGAEKTPQEMFDYVEQHLPQAKLLEGYGITECSPIVTLDPLNQPHLGVGQPLPGVSLLIVDSETGQPLEAGIEGEIYIAGPNVFSGYLGYSKQPFVQLLSKQWYVSGDRGFLSPEGNLILSGRSKRFVKIGGEMVGLSGLEEEILKLAHQNQWLTSTQEGPALALSVRGKEMDKPSLILFTTFKISVEEVNRGLKQVGFGRIAKVAKVCQLKEIPLMGTGKTNYRYLDELNLDEIPC